MNVLNRTKSKRMRKEMNFCRNFASKFRWLRIVRIQTRREHHVAREVRKARSNGKFCLIRVHDKADAEWGKAWWDEPLKKETKIEETDRKKVVIAEISKKKKIAKEKRETTSIASLLRKKLTRQDSKWSRANKEIIDYIIMVLFFRRKNKAYSCEISKNLLTLK